MHSPWTRQEARPGRLGPTVDSACFTTPFVRSSCSLRRGKLQQDAGRQKGVHGSGCLAFAIAAVPRPTSIHCTFSMPLLSDLWPEKSTPIRYNRVLYPGSKLIWLFSTLPPPSITFTPAFLCPLFGNRLIDFNGLSLFMFSFYSAQFQGRHFGQ